MDILVYTAVVLSCTQIIKTAFGIAKRFVPILALGIGGIFFVVAYFTGAVTFDFTSIMNAIVGVLTAMGLYSGVKATTK